jgi:thiol-disulfide isomerase/thioredoxin
MRFTNVGCCWSVCLLVTCALASAQDQAKRPRRLQGRPGETITKPDIKERVRSDLKVGDHAPSFTLPRVGGEGAVTLADHRGKQPVVLIFGTYSCPPYRRQIPALEDLYQQYRGRVEFVQVYIREAHPDSVLHVLVDGKEVLQKIEQTDTLAARLGNAQICRTTLKLTFPAVVDREDNKVSHAYGGWPNRLVIVDKEGKVAWLSEAKASAFRPDDVADWLEEHVAAGNSVEEWEH